MTLAILIIGLVIATCFIAYIADNIGKNLGKKRISIFGLRPRQTATLISMASSVAIMLLTVGIIMATSVSVRNALLRYDRVRAEVNELRRAQERLNQQNQALQRNSKEQSERIASQLKEIESNRAVAERSIKERRRVETQLQSASSRLETARRGADEARKRLASARQQFQTYKKQLAGAKAQVAAAKVRVQRAQSQVQDAQAQLQKEQGQVASTRNQLVRAHQEYANARKELSSAQTRLNQAQSNFKKVSADIVKTREELEDLQTEVNEKQLALTEVQQRLSEVRESTAEYEIIIDRIGRREIATPLGELFADSTLPAGMSSGQVREELSDLMQEGRAHLSSPPRNLKLAMPREAVLNKLSEDEFLNGFAAYLSTLNAPVSLRLLAARDYARGETEIFARLTPIIVRKVFSKDEVLDTTTIDATGGDARIFNQLLKLLNDAEQRARDRGVTPLLTPQSPLFYPAGTNERVFEALRKIQAEGGSVPVRLIAAEDISSIDSPRVRFEVGQSVIDSSP